jgi:hypothetical protein
MASFPDGRIISKQRRDDSSTGETGPSSEHSDADGNEEFNQMASVKRGTIAITRAWPFLYGAMLFGLIGWLNFITTDDHQYGRLAASFLEGKLYLVPSPLKNWADTAPFGGYHYSALAPLPALLMLPQVWMGNVHPGQLSLVVTLTVFYLSFQLARRFTYSYSDSCWLALAFCFGTSFVGAAALATSNHFAHVLAVMFLFAAIIEYEGRRRLSITGGLIGLALATRPPAGLNIICFVLLVLLGSGPPQKRMADLAKLALPFAALLGVLALYNYARFGNPLESGYGYQLNGMGLPYADWNVPGNRAAPPFSLSNIPSHLWIFLFGLPSSAGVGTSVLVLSPYLVYLCPVSRWDLTNKVIVVNVTIVLIVILAFRSTGFEQVGYRFSLDFLPFVFWLLMRSRVQVTSGFKRLVFIATVIDMCLTVFHLATGVDRRHGML